MRPLAGAPGVSEEQPLAAYLARLLGRTGAPALALPRVTWARARARSLGPSGASATGRAGARKRTWPRPPILSFLGSSGSCVVNDLLDSREHPCSQTAKAVRRSRQRS